MYTLGAPDRGLGIGDQALPSSDRQCSELHENLNARWIEAMHATPRTTSVTPSCAVVHCHCRWIGQIYSNPPVRACFLVVSWRRPSRNYGTQSITVSPRGLYDTTTCVVRDIVPGLGFVSRALQTSGPRPPKPQTCTSTLSQRLATVCPMLRRMILMVLRLMLTGVNQTHSIRIDVLAHE